MELFFEKRILFIIIFVVFLVLLTTPITEKNSGFDSDGQRYAAMAGELSLSPDLALQAPYCYRILTPYLASLLPLDTISNFRVLAFLSNVLSLYILYQILSTIGFEIRSRVLGVLLYSGSFWTLRFSFYSPTYIDYLTQLLLLLIIFFSLNRRYILLVFTLAIGAIQKESASVNFFL